ncbi:MAG TPA: LCP family protein [Armatimonadota bacterium]|nr:LCP family protein [Armatimonadota bacterium]
MRASPSHHSSGVGPSRWRSFFKYSLLALFILFMGAAGVGLGLYGKFIGAHSLSDVLHGLGSSAAVIANPRAYFPGRDRITVLCLGLDRNIMISRDPKKNGMPYTTGARSDVMMVASLDLRDQSVSILSVPRDTRVELPSGKTAKINQAHADGGIPYTRETVEKFLGVPVDYHVVIKQEAIQKVVDALGGLPINVQGALHNGERGPMDYDDNWGNLHIHLKPGRQVLNGEQVVGYMRFRHDQEGDFGRIRRQQQVIQALSQTVKNPAVLLKAPGLLDAIRAYVKTDLTPDQQLALANLFHRVDSGTIQTAQLPIAGDVKVGRVSYLEPDEFKKEAVVDWILRGNRDAMNRMIRISLKNASGDRELYQRTYNCLRHFGFDVVRSGRAQGDPIATTRAVQHGNLKGAARRVLEVLGVGGNVEKDDERGPDVTLYIGKDLANNQVLAMSESWPELPQRAVRLASRSETTRRPRRPRPAQVEIRSLEPASQPKEEEPAPSEPSAEPAPPADTPGTEVPTPAPPDNSTTGG